MNGTITRSLYFRLMALAFIGISGSAGSTYVLVLLLKAHVEPWTGWADMHSDYSTVLQFPSSFWKSVPNLVTQLELSRWLLVAYAFVNFAFFGFADEAHRHYRLVYTWLATRTRSGKQPI